jgi:hypothetical protein
MQVEERTLDPQVGKGDGRGVREARFVCASLLAAFALYAALGIYLSSFHEFWCSDMGARWAMMQNWLHGGSLIFLPYRNADVDPTGLFHPLGLLTSQHLVDGYMLRLPRGFCTAFPPLFPLISAVVYRLGGFYALTALPALAGVLTLGTVYLLARRLGLRSRLLVVAVLALATPLPIYSAIFWDHTVHMLVCAASTLLLLIALQTGRRTASVAAGALLGAGLFFHELCGLMFVSLLLTSALIVRSPSGRKAVVGMTIGFVPPLLVWLLANRLLFGLTLGPHLVIAENIRHSTDTGHLIGQPLMSVRALTLLFGYDTDWKSRISIAAVTLLAAGWAVCLGLGGKPARAAPLLLLPVVPITLGWLRQSHWALGLFQCTPLLLAAIAWPPRAQPDARMDARSPDESAAGLLYRWLFAAWALFSVAVIVNPQDGGLGWGCRFLLDALPWALLLAARNLETVYERSGDVDRLVAPAVAACLVAVGLFSTITGLGTIAYDERISQPTDGVYRTSAPVVVFGSFFLGARPAENRDLRVFAVRWPVLEGEAFYRCLDSLNVSSFTACGDRQFMLQMHRAGQRHVPPFAAVRDETYPANGVRFERAE